MMKSRKPEYPKNYQIDVNQKLPPRIEIEASTWANTQKEQLKTVPIINWSSTTFLKKQ